MKAKSFLLIAIFVALALLIFGFTNNNKGPASATDLEKRIEYLESEIAALKSLLEGKVVKPAIVPEKPVKEAKERVFLDGARGWDENGTVMWTADGVVPDYNVGIGTNTPGVRLDIIGTGGDSVSAARAVYDSTNSITGALAVRDSSAQHSAKGVLGEAIDATVHYNTGVYGEGRDGLWYSRGVYGYTYNAGFYCIGVTGEATSDVATAVNVGVYGKVHGLSTDIYGVLGNASGSEGATNAYALYASAADGSARNYGLYAEATSAADSNFGIFARATDATIVNWAGYFDGNCGITGNLDFSEGTTILDSDGDAPSSSGDVFVYDGTDYNWEAQSGVADTDWSGAGTGTMYATSTNDSVGIGTSTPVAKLHVELDANNYGWLGGALNSGADSIGVYGYGADYGVKGEVSVPASNRYGVIGQYDTDRYGFLGSLTMGVFGHYSADIYGFLASSAYGAYGQFDANRFGYLGGSLFGAYGQYSPSLYGYLGGASYGAFGQYSVNRYGYLGGSSYGAYGRYDANRYGYLGGSSYGAYGQYDASRYGYLGGSSYGAYGQYDPNRYGYLGSSSAAVYGQYRVPGSYAFYGYLAGSYGAYCLLSDEVGLRECEGRLAGWTNAAYGFYNLDYNALYTEGGYFENDNDYNDASNRKRGVYAGATGDNGRKYGIYAEASGSGAINYGIYARALDATTNWAGYFNGDAYVTGDIGAGSKSFIIDHPSDPLNKTLRHYTVESPDAVCMYRGRVKLDTRGEGTITMPDYFKDLTKEDEATVTLTSIGRPFDTGYEWSGDFSSFAVYGDPGREVSYIVLADRDDPVMRKLQRPVEEDKGPGNCEKGKLFYAEAYGYPKEMNYGYQPKPE